MTINWGLAGGGGFQNALATGVQLGSMAAERRDRNALLELRGKELEAKQAEAQAKAAAQAQEVDVKRRAAAGDPEAMSQLAGLDFNAWRGLNSDVKAQAAERSKIIGNAALDVLQRPPEQRAAVWDAYIDNLAQTMPELAQYKGQYNEQAARSAIAQAEMIGKLHELEQPKYMAIPEGGTLVDTRNPQAVQQFGQGAAPQGGAPVQITGEDDYNALPPGAEYIDPQGNRRTKGGAGAAGLGANFLQGL